MFQADSSKWLDFGAARGAPSWLEVMLPEPRRLTAYSLTSADDAPERDPCDFTLEGAAASEPGAEAGAPAPQQLTWAVLDAQEGLHFAARHESRHFAVRKRALRTCEGEEKAIAVGCRENASEKS